MTQDPTTALRSIKAYTERLTALHELFVPHSGQVIAGRAYFDQGAKVIFLQCGRNFGKSLLGTYFAVRHGMTNPNAAIYIIGPKQKQEAEIIWHSGYLRNMIPKEYLGRGSDSFNHSQLRVWFDTGSFIKIDGSDNYDDLRGYKPDLLIIDEFKDWQRESYQAMEPNLKAKNATVLIIGTPPDAECFYTQMRSFVMSKQKSGDKSYFYLALPTETNPHIDKELLAQTREDMIERGEEAIWEREYMARYVPGGASSIFPKFSVASHVKMPALCMEIARKDRKKLQWFCIFDPGTTTVFAVLFGCINPYTGQIVLLDEIYERDRSLCSTTQIWERAMQICDQLNPKVDSWTFCYDEAAAWFAVEVLDKYGVPLLSTNKFISRKETQISLIRDIMRYPNKLLVSNLCVNFISEVQNYVTDKNGRYPKTGDHLIDCFRYMLGMGHYEINPAPDPDVQIRDQDPRDVVVRTFAQDLAEAQRERDPFMGVEDVIEDGIDEEEDEWETMTLSED